MQQQMTAGSFVYLDNSSTTKPCLEAVQAVLHSMEENWGNPSSLHSLGFQAERAVEDARQAVADALSCRSEEILFVSGGTEGNNLAILGAAYARKKQGTHLVTSAIEHPAVLHVMQYLEKEGFSVTYLRPDAQGRILIPAKLRTYAGLEKDVVVIGVSNRAEIWNAERWQAVEDEELDPAKLFAAMEELDF